MITIDIPSENFCIPVIKGVSDACTQNDIASLRSTLARYGVVCLKMDHPLEKEAFERISNLFGPVKDPVGRTKHGELFRYSPKRQIIDAGYVLTEAARQQMGDKTYGGLDDQRPGLFETYHCDDTFAEAPAQATILHARQLPPSGGGPTHFIDMRAAYNQLDKSRQARLAGLAVRYAYNNENPFPLRQAASSEADILTEVVHPLVRTHPMAGTKALFIDLDRAKHIEDMPIDEGRALLQSLQDFAEDSAPTCHHDWHDHDVLVWDNASVQHKAEGNFKVGEPRRFWRHMISGPRPA